jgi:hypothetical protein
VSYLVAEPYPATVTIEKIRSDLESQGWRPRDVDVLSPDLTLSSFRGWTQYEDARGGAPIQIYQWDGQWEEAGGRVASYTLKYHARMMPNGLIVADGPLQVLGMVFSAETVERLRRETAAGAQSR